MQYPLVINFCGNDSAGMAGIAMDMRVQQAMQVHSVNIITANTAQNSQKLISINPVSDDVFIEQLQAVQHFSFNAIKVGMLCSRLQIDTIADFAKQSDLPLIVDPVLASSSGSHFIDEVTLQHFIRTLLPLTDLLTPNLPEVELLTGINIQTAEDIENAAQWLLKNGAKAVFIKGGHNTKSVMAQDYFCNADKSFWLSSSKQNTVFNRGTGCAIASAFASCAALGYSIYDAAVIAKMMINQGLRQSYQVDELGPVNVTHFADTQIDLPYLSRTADIDELLTRDAFPPIWPKLGLYPIVDRSDWIERLAESGITTIQLRVKDLQGQDLEDEIQKGVILAAKHNCRLFVNDYWQLAIKYQAHGVHLGQEDLDDADLDKIHGTGLRLGISTHCHYEVARAHLYKPSYIACGPTFHTTTKDMPWIPQGVEGLSYWQKTLDYPLVAIGGIKQENLSAVAATGVQSIAMITAITLADDPKAVAQEFIQTINRAC